jgi:hypothetical protein
LVAQKVMEAFGGRPKISTHLDVGEQNSVHIAELIDCPEPGITSYSTVDLSDFPMYLGGREFESRIEIAGAAQNHVDRFADAIGTAAFCVIKDQWAIHPYAIFPDVMRMYELSATMRHVMFMEPFFWPALEDSVQFPDRMVTWLQMVPIAESEYRFAEAESPAALGQLFEDKHIDVCDLQRKPVV